MGRFPSPHTVCTILGCERPHKSRGLCASHYAQWLRKGLLPQVEKPAHCTRTGCDKPILAKGFCSKHYKEDLEHRRQSGTQPEPLRITPPGHCPRCGKLADKLHLSRCRSQPKIRPGDGDARHGTPTGYCHHHCRCIECTAANAEAGKRRRIRQGKRPPQYVSTTALRMHLRVVGQYVPLYAVALAANTNLGAIRWALRSKRMNAAVADRLLGVTVSEALQQVRPTSYVPIDRARAMANELVEAGWSKRRLEIEIGHRGHHMSVFRPDCRRIQAQYARAIEQLHDEAWRNNTNNFRRHCQCIQVSEPETLHATERQQRSRERRSA